MEPSRTALRFGRDERGQLVVLFTLGMFTLLLFVSLSINVGQAVVRRHQAQVLADTGALAGAAVQSRGLNQITRVNAASLRLFNLLQMRSRVGGYHESYVPLLKTIGDLLAARRIPDKVTVTVPQQGNRPSFTRTQSRTGLVTWAIKRIVSGIKGFVGRDDQDAFRAMEPWFAGMRMYMRSANFMWEIRARQVAYDVTRDNIRTLVGNRTAAACSSGDCARPAFSMPGLGDVGSCAKGIGQVFKDQRGTGKSRQSFTDWARSLLDLRSGRWLDVLEGCSSVPRLIPNWENPDGDVLIIRYWTDITIGDQAAIMKGVAALLLTPMAPFVPVIEGLLAWGIPIESALRKAAAPKWHDMRVTLHRKRAAKAADQFAEDTRFVYWVKLPTTRPSVSVFYPFVDLPEITAVAVAKPVGGNVGAYPRIDPLKKNHSALGWLMRATQAASGFADDIVKPNEHVYSTTVYGVYGQRPSRRGAKRPRTGGFDERSATITSTYSKAQLEKMGFNPKDPENIFWYVSPQFPYYEPRLVPMQEAYLDDIDLTDDQKARLRELYGLKAKRGGWWPF